MSIGEILNLYRDQELIINPNFQRYFVWSASQKTKFIESIILGIPIPPIFVYQNDDGVWELVDGLQRISTILQFAGELRRDGGIDPPLILDGTKALPSLANKTWDSVDGDTEPIERARQLEIKRARMRVEILKRESDPLTKFELFQRLNTGGTQLKPQEVRNVVMLMIDEHFYNWVSDLARYEDFVATISLPKQALQRQQDVELVLRFFAYRNVPYQSGLDVHEYLDSAVIAMAVSNDFDRDSEASVFKRTFAMLHQALGGDAFKRWDGERFTGMFLMSAYEMVAYGLSKNVDDVEALPKLERAQVIKDKILNMWNDDTFQRNSGAGVRGTTRLRNLLPVAGKFFKVD
jgi:hypothetical protein